MSKWPEDPYAKHFYRGGWPRLSYTSTMKKSPLGHYYFYFVHDHTRPANVDQVSRDVRFA